MVMKKVGHFADFTAKKAGSPMVVSLSIGTLVLFLGIGPYFHFSESYQIVANTYMSAVSYLMIFVLQHNQNKENKVLHMKLNAILGNRFDPEHELIGIEDLTVEEIDEMIEASED